MRFLWPEVFWLLAALPALVLLYIVLLRRRKKTMVRYASLGLVKQAMAGKPSWKRHVPPALFLLALAAMLLAGTRPQAVITLPSDRKSVV